MINRYIYIGIGVTALLAIGAITYQYRVINSLQAEKAVLTAEAARRDTLIDAQNAGIAGLEKAAAESATALEAAGDRIDTLNTKLAAERSKRNAAVEKDYVRPDCVALLATDLAAVCPAHAQRLRDAAAIR
jgi:hypothetical protein